MYIISELKCNLSGLNSFAKTLTEKSKAKDIYLLSGDLGAGKTTFTRFFIKHHYKKFKIDDSNLVKSPSFPIMINYPLVDYEINHYDLYRITKEKDLLEIDLFENFEKNISIIEWPEIILNNYKLKKYFFIEFEIINENERFVRLSHSTKRVL